MRPFEARTADEAWLLAARAFIERAGTRAQESRDGPTVEIPQAVFVISDPRQRWAFSRFPPANIALALAEVVWIVTGRNDAEFLTRWSKTYAKFAGNARYLHGAYGDRLRKKQGLDQLERAYLALKHKPSSRQVVLQIWDAASDMPFANGTERDADVPCNVISMVKVRDNKLEWTQIIRSNDLHRGVPFNFVQFTTLQEILAGWLGILPGNFTQLSDSLHVYERELDLIARSQPVSQLPVNDDSLLISKDDCDAAFSLLGRRIDELSTTDSTESVEQMLQCTLPVPLFNFLAVFCAEKARQMRDQDTAFSIIDKCSNPLLRQAWTRWAHYLQDVQVVKSVATAEDDVPARNCATSENTGLC